MLLSSSLCLLYCWTNILVAFVTIDEFVTFVEWMVSFSTMWTLLEYTPPLLRLPACIFVRLVLILGLATLAFASAHTAGTLQGVRPVVPTTHTFSPLFYLSRRGFFVGFQCECMRR